jgi:hypothetical protein
MKKNKDTVKKKDEVTKGEKRWLNGRNRCNKWHFSGIKIERTNFLHFNAPRRPVHNGQSISHSLAPGRIVA